MSPAPRVPPPLANLVAPLMKRDRKSTTDPELIRANDSMHAIPKRIIQTGRHVNLPLKQRAVVSNLTLLNPDYEYLYFDNEQVETFLDREFRQYRKVFDSFRFSIQRYDFFRYLAVYRYG